MSRTETKRKEGRQWKQVTKCCSYSDTSQNLFDLIPFDDVPTLLKHKHTHTHTPELDHGTKTEVVAQEINCVLILCQSKQTNNVWMHACELQRSEIGEEQVYRTYYPSA